MYFYLRGNPASGRPLLDALAATDARALPRRYGETEPFRQRFERQAFLRFWRREMSLGAVIGPMWKAGKPWSDGSVLPAGSCTDDEIRPTGAPCVSCLTLDYAHSLREAAVVFDAVAAAMSAEVAIAEPSFDGVDYLIPVRGWWLGLPVPAAKRWWFGPTYAALLAGHLPEKSNEGPGGAVIVTDPKWRAPSHLRTRDLTEKEHQAIEDAFIAAPDEATRKRIVWQQAIMVAPADVIPTFVD